MMVFSVLSDETGNEREGTRLTLNDQCKLSYYKELTRLKENHPVFLVQHTETDRIFVKKVLPTNNTRIFRSLKAEPVKNMPAIVELFEEGEQVTVIEEYIAGETLEGMLKQHGPYMESDVVFDWISQLCMIVKALHERTPAIIHRDIKPSNIILSPDGVIKLLDVSAAKLDNPGADKDTVLMGTAGYAAPEQYGFSVSTKETDIYAIGVLMNELLTGKLPQAHLAGGAAGNIIRKCTRLEQEERYHTIDELMRAIPGGKQYLSRRSSQTYDSKTDQEPRKLRDYLPPGFRKGNPLAAAAALVGYAMIISICADLKWEGVSGSRLWTYRISCMLVFLFIVLVSGNYLGMLDKVPFLAKAPWWLRLIEIVILDGVILFLLIAFLSITFSL